MVFRFDYHYHFGDSYHCGSASNQRPTVKRDLRVDVSCANELAPKKLTKRRKTSRSRRESTFECFRRLWTGRLSLT